MSENPYPIQVGKALQVILVYNAWSFIPSVLFLLIIFSLFAGLHFLSLIILIPVLGFYLISCSIQIIYKYLYLSSLKYSVTGQNFFFAGGIISKFEKNLPYSRIQHIIIYESFWQRMFGLASVSIETAGGSGVVSPGNFQWNVGNTSNQNTPISTGPLIPNLNKEDAEKLKNQIISTSQKYKSVAGI